MYRTQVISPRTLQQTSQEKWSHKVPPRRTQSPPVSLEQKIIKQRAENMSKNKSKTIKHGFDQEMPDTEPLTLTESVIAISGTIAIVFIGTLFICVLLGYIS